MVVELSSEERKQQGRELADEMRAFLREHGSFNRAFSIHPDTPLSVIWAALEDLYGPAWDTEMNPEDYIEVMRWDFPHVYLREDPSIDRPA